MFLYPVLLSRDLGFRVLQPLFLLLHTLYPSSPTKSGRSARSCAGRNARAQSCEDLSVWIITNTILLLHYDELKDFLHQPRERLFCQD